MNLRAASFPCTAALACVLASAQDTVPPQPYRPQNPMGQGAQGQYGQYPQFPQQPGMPNPQNPAGIQRASDPNLPQGQHTYYGDTLYGRWLAPPPGTSFEGWPSFPNQLSGYGNFAREAARAGLLPLPLAPSPPEPEGWPSWTRARGQPPLPFAPDLALLIRLGDRVWLRTADEDTFVPLYFHDKLRTLRTGARVEVRQVGEFELLLHRGTRLVSRGPGAVELGKLDEKQVQLRIADLTWVRIATSEREHTIELPDGSTLTIPPPTPAASGAPTILPLAIFGVREPVAGLAEVVIVRADEPRWLGGRATIANLGSTEVRWRHASGELVLQPRERVTFFLQRPVNPVPAALTTTGVDADVRDTVATCRAQQPGTASWSGASFDLPAGAAVRFDAVMGRPFAPVARNAQKR